ncbi:Bidirectional sugar transporter SWEET4 [Euphorbia peplus]|nr:Bidirectional sugar transporter SWEET4 [Euphorbia peplus]
MVSAEAARNVVGIIGNVISFFLFLSPLPTFFCIIKNKDTQEFQFYPYVATVLNCMFWVLYGLPFVTEDNILVVTINGVGLVLELIYLAIFCYYDKQNKGRKKVALGLSAELIFIAIVVIITITTFHTHTKRALFVGIFCDVFNILMYSSPLLIMKKVIKTKSVEYMPLFLSLTNFANGCIWTTYALIKLDMFILISNGIGALAGAAQLILYSCYYNSTPEKELLDPVKPPVQIQLQKSKDLV